MCRIVGFTHSGLNNAQAILSSMRDTMTHGGPDDAGEYIDDRVALGHRRLSIIDLSNFGHQPLVSPCKNYALVYNGEIYNYQRIKEELLALGCQFTGHSDSEVLLHAWLQWGAKSLEKFRGMFAFCFYDLRAKKLTLVRDRAGVKPLYYYFNGRDFLFASEVKAFHEHPGFEKQLNHEALQSYFQYGYVMGEQAIFENTYRVLPGHILTVDFSGERPVLHKEKYWDVYDCYKQPKLDVSFEQACGEFEGILKEAFSLRMVADVPVGMFLSGGFDSTTLLALLTQTGHSKINTFTIGFDDLEFNEAVYAKEIARHFGSTHHEYYLSEQDSINIIPELPNIWDEPFADASQIPTYLVAKLTQQEVKVSLSADGGDEQLFGYPKYWKTLERYQAILKHQWLFKLIATLPNKVLIRLGHTLNLGDKFLKTKQILRSKAAFMNTYDVGQHVYSEDHLRHLFTGAVNSDSALSAFFTDELSGDIESMLALDYKTYMCDDILCKVDRATMSVALEGREPFLDHKIIEYLARLPMEYKYKDGVTKRILREILYQYMPKAMMERPKMGFGIPLETWCRSNSELKGLLRHYLSQEQLDKTGVLSSKAFMPEIKRYFAGQSVSFNKIWSMFIFMMWFERWM